MLHRVVSANPLPFMVAQSMPLPEIEKAVTQLSRHDLTSFRDWFSHFDATAWDQQFEDDVNAGRLDALYETPGLSQVLELLPSTPRQDTIPGRCQLPTAQNQSQTPFAAF
jgi:hypothetical protein